MTKQEWIKKMVPYAVNAMRLYNYPASVLLAQCCLETGFGSGYNCEVLVKWGNVLGMKASLLNDTWTSKWWTGKSATKNTPEVYNGVSVRINDAFRVYSGGSDNGFQDCFNDYCQFMLDARYSKGGAYKYRDVLTMGDPAKVIQAVSMRGYATDPAYATSVMHIIKEYNLTEYDKEPRAVPAPKIIANKNFGLHNTYERTSGIKFVTMHYIGATGTAKNNVEWYNNQKTTGFSADLFTDFDGTNYGYNMDIRNRACKAVGGDKQSNYGGTLYKVATNQNCINIEMCVRNKGKQETGSPDWYFEDATVEGAAQLAAYLLYYYCIPIDRLIRHYDINGKYCPGVTGWIEPMGGEAKWLAFKERVRQIMDNQHEVIRRGSNGEEVRKFQQGLLDLGVCDCRDYVDRNFADGDFGARTETYVKHFQRVFGLDVDGICGKNTWAVMDEKLAKLNTAKVTFTVAQFLAMAKKKTTYFRVNGYKYGNPYIAPWYCPEKKETACDRSVVEILNALGLCLGNVEVEGLLKKLLAIGGVKITNVNNLKAGDIVFSNDYKHVFICAGKNLRYDCGTNERIQLTEKYGHYSEQPFNEGIVGFSVGVRLPFVEEEKTKTRKELVRYGQEQAVKFTGVDMQIDGVRGRETNQQIRRCLQKGVNLMRGLNIKEDGLIGDETRGAFNGVVVKYGDTNWVVTALELACYMKGLDPNGIEKPGHYGDGLSKALGSKYMDANAILNIAN